MATEVSQNWRVFGDSFSWLLLLTATVTVFNCCYLFCGIAFFPLSELIAGTTIPLAIMIWVVWDAGSRRCTPCYDFGLMVYLGWVLVIPGYLLWTRGWRGLRVILGLICLYFFPLIVPLILLSVIYSGF